MTVIDIDEGSEQRWFEMDGGGRVRLRTLSVGEFKEIQKKTVRKKVDYKKVDGTPGRFEYLEVNEDLQNEMYWDAVIVAWENIQDRHGKEIPCTKENKTILMTRSKVFLDFVVESLRALSEEETAQQETEAKN